jgi:AcrR family transcriptional regulator
MKNQKLSRKKREQQRHKKEILDAALSLFAEKGFHDVSMQEIAHKAEFSVGKLYSFFAAKQDLYEALLEDRIQTSHARIAKALAIPGDELTKIRSAVEERIALFYHNIEFIKLYLEVTRGLGCSVRAEFRERTRDYYRDLTAQICTIFKSGIEKKRFKDVDPMHLTLSLIGMLNEFFIFHMDHPEQPRIKAEDILSIFLNQIELEPAERADHTQRQHA